MLIGSHTLHREASAPRERVKPICSFFGSTPLTRIFTDSVREYIGQRKKQDAANRTINMEICILRRILKRAKRWHMMADEIPHLPERCDIGRALTFEEKSRLLHVASARPEGDTARLAAMLTLNTTMRGCELKGLCSVLAGPNPVHDAEIPKGRPAGETCAYSLEEELKMLAVLPEPAAAVVATAAFTGARKGEIRGLLWENYDGSELRVKHSVWRSHVGEPKSPKSQGTIPVIAPLRVLLDRHRARCGGPGHGFIFASAKGQPMNLEALAIDVVRPALEKAGLNWHGWHAFRRGLATNLHRLGVSDKVIQQILRHANVTTTMNIYVKTATADAENAMKTLETMCATTVQLLGLESSRVM